MKAHSLPVKPPPICDDRVMKRGVFNWGFDRAERVNGRAAKTREKSCCQEKDSARIKGGYDTDVLVTQPEQRSWLASGGGSATVQISSAEGVVVNG